MITHIVRWADKGLAIRSQIEVVFCLKMCAIVERESPLFEVPSDPL